MVFDVIIAGGGLVGLSLAIALEKSGMKIAIVDILPPVSMLDAKYDGRSSAIAYANMRMLDVLGVKAEIGEMCHIDDILVSDGRIADGAKIGGSLGFSLHFDKIEVNDNGEPLGYMVENRYMRLALDKVAAKSKNIVRYTPNRIIDFEQSGSFVNCTLDNNIKLQARLLVGCDGRGSQIRKLAKIKTYKFDYNQTGLVTTVEMDLPHNNVAFEYFLPTGPFAILPLSENRASIVWSEPPKKANAIKNLHGDDFNKELSKRFGDFLGEVKQIAPCFSYPLQLELASDWYKSRVALCGDAAHGIHPVAGQGFNLGLKDVAALAEVLIDAHRLGLDIGDEIVLENYAKWRRTDTMMVAAACDGFVRLFSNDIAPIRFIRNLGLGIVDKLPPVRQFFARHAGAGVGDMPKLLMGNPLV
jgi:2-octaprenyl-6-methoxyphenol hydroxylase